jgi:hypothetical protein
LFFNAAFRAIKAWHRILTRAPEIDTMKVFLMHLLNTISVFRFFLPAKRQNAL